MFLSEKSNAPGSAVLLPYLSTAFIAESGIGMTVNFRRFTFLPVAKLKNLWVPCRFPVGPRLIAGLERDVIEFVGLGSS